MQLKMLYLRDVFDLGKACAGGEGTRSPTRHDFRRVIEENFIDHAGSKRYSVYRRSAFNHHTRNLKLSQAAQHGVNIRMPSGIRLGLFDPNATLLQFSLLCFVGGCAEDDNIVPLCAV